MAKKGALKRSAATGKIVAEFRNGLFLGQSGKAQKRAPLAGETAAALAPRLGKALNTPGVRKDAVFGKPAGNKVVYAYLLDPTDTTKLVREWADGRRTVGRMVGGKFAGSVIVRRRQGRRVIDAALEDQRRPPAIVLAGHNGSGKSTLW